MTKIIIEENCVNPSRNELELVLPVVEGYLQAVLEKYAVDSLKYIVFSDSDQCNFNESVRKYSSIIGTETNITDNEGYQTAAKSIDGINEAGEYQQAIIAKGMLLTTAYFDLLRLIDKLTPAQKQATDNMKYLSLTTLIHEIGHAVDNLYQYNREGYCDNQIAFDLTIKEEYQKYLERSTLSLWGEYFAERFCYETLGEEVFIDKGSIVCECIKDYSIDSRSNQITERIHMILYFFVHSLCCTHALGRKFDFLSLENDTCLEYISYLQMVEKCVIQIFELLLEWDDDLFEKFIDIYHNLLTHEKNKYK